MSVRLETQRLLGIWKVPFSGRVLAYYLSNWHGLIRTSVLAVVSRLYITFHSSCTALTSDIFSPLKLFEIFTGIKIHFNLVHYFIQLYKLLLILNTSLIIFMLVYYFYYVLGRYSLTWLNHVLHNRKRVIIRNIVCLKLRAFKNVWTGNTICFYYSNIHMCIT